MIDSDASHILVVDDDRRLRALLQRFLRENGYFVSVAQDADDARQMLAEYKFDLLIVDIMMPKETGLVFLEKLRKENRVPVILLTAMGETADRITGLELGADDYLPKPFEPKELLLRLKNILKRAPKIKVVETVVFDFGECVYDAEKKELISKQGEVIHITPVEQSLLSVLSEKSGQIFSREELADILGAGQSPRSIDVQITRLRKKLEPDSKNPKYLKTIRGKGYMLLTKQ
ncbi:MAG: response regulator transcription factor [Alphaproteobacteria bacterium]|nr:response regulator transcription factor [Alphaproteobacteria bacterium]MBQ8678002.1 response regulator transcription factor [Alphaproteobacteria bacterium]